MTMPAPVGTNIYLSKTLEGDGLSSVSLRQTFFSSLIKLGPVCYAQRAKETDLTELRSGAERGMILPVNAQETR